MYSLAGNRNFARKEELIFKTIYRIPHLQCRPYWVTAHAQLPFPWCKCYKESAASPITIKAREYMSRCNAVENIHILKVIGPWDRVIFVPETEAIISKVPLACPITKASNSSHFHIPLIFLFSTFPVMQYNISFSFFDIFSHLRNLKQSVHRGVTTPQGQQHVWSAQLS